jgi:Putative transposase
MCACCRSCSAACFWSISRTLSTLANCNSSPPWKGLRDSRAFARYLEPLKKVKWVVYAKRPFAGPEQVLDYVGRYTHRIAISNNRLLDIEAGQVSFRYKDYRNQSQQKTMILSAEEFIRRFLLHALPHGFHRIRYYGFLGNRNRQEKLALCRQLLGMAPPMVQSQPSEVQDYRERCEELTGVSLRVCPVCRRGQMVLVDTLAARRRPAIKDTS